MPALKKDNWLYPALICIICFIVSLLNRQNPFDMTYMRYDSSIYQYIGWQMTEGKIPYRDIFDHKGPVIYFWNMLGYGLHPMLGQWFLEFCALFVSAILAFKMGCRFISPVLSILTIGVVFFNIPIDDTIGNVESLATLLSYLLLYIFVEYIDHEKTSEKKTTSFGAISALLLFLKPTYLATPAVFISVIALKMLLKKQYEQLFIYTLYFMVGFLGITASIIGWLHYHQALGDFWHYYIDFNLEYATCWKNSNNVSFILHSLLINHIIISMVVTILWLSITFYRYQLIERQLIATLTLAFGLNLICIILPNNLFLHYLYILYPLAFLLLVLAIKPWQKKILFMFLIGICFIISLRYCIMETSKNVSNTDTQRAARMIDELLEKDETFQTLGWDMARLHLLSKRACTSPYVMTGMYDRLHPNYLYNLIQNKRPPLVAILPFSDGNFYDKLINTHWKNFHKDYVLVFNYGGYEIYVLRERLRKNTSL